MERVSNPKKKKEHQSKMKQPGRIPTVFFFGFGLVLVLFFCVCGARRPVIQKKTNKQQKTKEKTTKKYNEKSITEHWKPD